MRANLKCYRNVTVSGFGDVHLWTERSAYDEVEWERGGLFATWLNVLPAYERVSFEKQRWICG